ncbi:hypothetical protein MLD38_030589 [Melastoma candidum]|uniref:Uncharacterized protein n=1 Tax=Melastoma candidum TaxID=119954 RepID=A0ACB9MMP0_9MYRT|nr:hypothetical protein MLD38_030589 [Melastoma candidum]
MTVSMQSEGNIRGLSFLAVTSSVEFGRVRVDRLHCYLARVMCSYNGKCVLDLRTRCCLAAHKYALAIDLYTKAIELNQDNAVYLANRAFAHTKMDEYEHTIQDASKAIEVDPKYSKGCYRRGAAYLAVGKFQDAHKDFQLDNNLDLVVRSHEVKDVGYEIEREGKLITVFSAPNYCDQMGNEGAFIRFIAPDLKPDIVILSVVPHPDVKPVAYANNFLWMFSKILQLSVLKGRRKSKGSEEEEEEERKKGFLEHSWVLRQA